MRDDARAYREELSLKTKEKIKHKRGRRKALHKHDCRQKKKGRSGSW